MSETNLNISINDFENICRTCLSREDLKSLYEKCSQSSLCVAEKLMSCSYLQFAEDDGFPVKICKLCINEINQTYSFLKRCETTDAILRKCVTNKNVFVEVEDKINTDIKPEIVYLNTPACIENFEQEDNANLEFKPEIILPIVYEPEQEVLKDYEEIQQPEQVNIKIEEDNVDYDCVDNFADERYEEDANESPDETVSEKYDSSSGHSRKISLDSHLKNVCSVCSKAFPQPSKLRIHMRVHTGEKPYACKFCPKAFSLPDTLKHHMRIHTGEKPYSCELCSKRFTLAKYLKCHMRNHTGDKPYICEVCNKAFNALGALKVHMRIHTGDKPFTCQVCSKAFTLLHNLKSHTRIHTGEKPYTCEVCTKSFTQSDTLKYHMRIHTGEKPYSCKVCSKRFTLAKYLKGHENTHRGKDLHT